MIEILNDMTQILRLQNMVSVLYILFLKSSLNLRIEIIINIKSGGQCMAERERFTPCQSEDPFSKIHTN